MKTKKKRRKIRVKGLILLFLIAYLICMIIYYVAKHPINNIVVTGNNLVTEKEIIDMLDINESSTLLSVKTFNIKKKMKDSNPIIKNVKISKSIFGNIKIEITENKILFYNLLDKKLVLENGSLIEDDSRYLGYPTVINYVPSETYLELVKAFSKLDIDIIKMISEIEYSPSRYEDTIIDSERFMLKMNDGNTVYANLVNIEKLNKYQTICTSTDIKGILYLDSSSKNYIFKSYEEAKKEEAKEDSKGKKKNEN